MRLRPRKWSRFSPTVRAPCVGVGAFVVGAHQLPVPDTTSVLKSMGGRTSKESRTGGSENRGGSLKVRALSGIRRRVDGDGSSSVLCPRCPPAAELLQPRGLTAELAVVACRDRRPASRRRARRTCQRLASHPSAPPTTQVPPHPLPPPRRRASQSACLASPRPWSCLKRRGIGKRHLRHFWGTSHFCISTYFFTWKAR